MAGQEMDRVYRAIGRYVVEFSLLVVYMRVDIAGVLTGETDTAALAHLALGESSAKQIADAFFAICVHVYEPNADEKKILGFVQRHVNDEITRRNDFAHGDWFTAFPPEGGFASSLVLVRTKPSRKSTPGSHDELSSDKIEGFANDVDRIASWVNDIGWICLSRVERRRLSDYFELGPAKTVARKLIGPRSGSRE